jgi:hypothetical protein
MPLKAYELSPMATVTAECLRCNRVFYVDTDYPQEWLDQHAPRANPGETVSYPCPEHLVLPWCSGRVSPDNCRAAVYPSPKAES